ncbi:carbohydrate ABC transporter permease, partial [Actinomadura adrarensis]
MIRRWADRLSPLLVALFCLLPFYWMVVSSLRRPGDILDMSFLPSPLSLENYQAVFQPGNGFLRALGNSVVVAGTTTALTLVVGTTAAYAL